MAHHSRTVEVPASPEDAFAYLADFTNTEKWDPGTVEAQRLGNGPIGVGSRFRVVVGFFGRRLEFDYEMVEYEPPRRLVLEGTTKSARSRDTITIEPAGTGSAITYDVRLDLKGPLRVLDKGLQVAFTGMADKAADGLRRALGG